MSARERKQRTRWPGMALLRRQHNRRYRAAVRLLLGRGRNDAIVPPRRSSAKWEVW